MSMVWYAMYDVIGRPIYYFDNLEKIEENVNKSAEEMRDDIENGRRCVAALRNEESSIVVIRKMVIG